MDNTIKFIIDAITHNPNDQSLGEEMRALQETLFIHCISTQDPLHEFLFVLITQNPNDIVLGSKMRQIKHKLIEYVNA
jgi:hypothetical protein